MLHAKTYIDFIYIVWYTFVHISRIYSFCLKDCRLLREQFFDFTFVRAPRRRAAAAPFIKNVLFPMLRIINIIHSRHLRIEISKNEIWRIYMCICLIRKPLFY